MSETPTRLLEAARACIVAHGVAGTTSRAIATTAGTNLQAITYHYGSKDALVAQALVATVRRWVEPAMVVMAEPGDPAGQMLAAVHALTIEFEQHRDDAPALLEALALAPRVPELGEAVRALWDGLRAQLVDHIGALAARGQVPAWVDPPAMASLLIATANGLALQVTVDPTGPGVPAMAGQLAALLLTAGGSPHHTPTGRNEPPR